MTGVIKTSVAEEKEGVQRRAVGLCISLEGDYLSSRMLIR